MVGWDKVIKGRREDGCKGPLLPSHHRVCSHARAGAARRDDRRCTERDRPWTTWKRAVCMSAGQQPTNVTRLQGYLRWASRRHAAAVAMAPFTIFLHQGDTEAGAVAIPDAPVGAEALGRLLVLPTSGTPLGERRLRLTFLAEFAPDLAVLALYPSETIRMDKDTTVVVGGWCGGGSGRSGRWPGGGDASATSARWPRRRAWARPTGGRAGGGSRAPSGG